MYNNFADTGDWMRSSKPDLESVINSGVRVLIFDGMYHFYFHSQTPLTLLIGDADYILNFNVRSSFLKYAHPIYRVDCRVLSLW